MQVVVKTPRTNFQIQGKRLPEKLVNFVRAEYGKKAQINDDDELVDITTTDWYKQVRARMTPGDTIRNYRENMKLTQAALGKLVGFSPKVISDLENNRRSITLKNARPIAKALGIKVSRIIGE